MTRYVNVYRVLGKEVLGHAHKARAHALDARQTASEKAVYLLVVHLKDEQ